MKIKILGAGPPGPYVAILLKRGGLAADLSVVEQNASDSTFGFGVDAALEMLRMTVERMQSAPEKSEWPGNDQFTLADISISRLSWECRISASRTYGRTCRTLRNWYDRLKRTVNV